MGALRIVCAGWLLLSCACLCSGQAYSGLGVHGTYGHGLPPYSYYADQEADQQQGARHLLAYGSYGGRHLLQTYGSYGGRHLLQAYSVQQFMAETIGLKYSQGNKRRLLDASPPAAGTYKTVILPGGGYGAQSPLGINLTEDIGSAVTVLPTEGAYGGKMPGAYGSTHVGIPAPTAYGRF